MRNVTGEQQGRVVAALRGISLADLKRVANSAGLKPVVISGRLNAYADATGRAASRTCVVRPMRPRTESCRRRRPSNARCR